MHRADEADHCIGEGGVPAAAEAQYVRYGGLFAAMRGAKWLLLPHAVNVTGDGPALANAFEMPHAPGRASLWAVMLGGAQTSAKLSVAHLPDQLPSAGAEGGAYQYQHMFEAQYPGPPPHTWTPLPGAVVIRAAAGGGKGGGATAVVQVQVPLHSGCALVRLRPSTTG